MKSEPFPKEAFYSDMTKETISDEDYTTYLNDAKNFKIRLGGLVIFL